jgi:hypothetical protein
MGFLAISFEELITVEITLGGCRSGTGLFVRRSSIVVLISSGSAFVPRSARSFCQGNKRYLTAPAGGCWLAFIGLLLNYGNIVSKSPLVSVGLIIRRLS